MGHNASPYDYIIHVGIITCTTFAQSHTSLNNSFQPSLDYKHPKLDNECTGHPVVNLIAQVVNTSGSIWTGGMTSDWVLLLTRGHVHTHTRVCTHTTKCSALAWSLYIISHTTPLHLADGESAYIHQMKQQNNLCLKPKCYYMYTWKIFLVPQNPTAIPIITCTLWLLSNNQWLHNDRNLKLHTP